MPRTRRMAAMAIAAGLMAVSPQARAQDKKEVRVGVILRIGREEGFKMKQMVDLMIDQQNKAGGVQGRQIKTFVYDEGCTPNVGVDATTRAIEQDRVHVILGASCSGVTLAMVPITAKLETPEITGQSTATAITQQGSAWIYRTSVPDKYQAAALADYLAKELGKKKIAVLNETDALGSGFAADFMARLKSAYNMEPIDVEQSTQDDTDYRSQLIKIKNAGPDVLAIFEHEAESARIVVQARAVGLPSSVLRAGASTLSSREFPTLAGSAADKVVFTGTFNPYDTRPDIAAYTKLVQDNWKLLPDQNYSQTTDAVNILFSVLKTTPIDGTDDSVKADRAKIRDGLNKVANYKGLAGTTTFCAAPTPDCRDGNKDVRIFEYDGGGPDAKIKTVE